MKYQRQTSAPGATDAVGMSVGQPYLRLLVSARRTCRCYCDRRSASVSIVVTLAHGEGAQQRQTWRMSGGLASDASSAKNQLQELTGQHLSHHQMHDLQSDRRVCWLGNRQLKFKCAGHVAAIRAIDVEVSRPLLSVSASVASDFQPSDGIIAIFVCVGYKYLVTDSWLSFLDIWHTCEHIELSQSILSHPNSSFLHSIAIFEWDW
jgi:hypothetical protein